MRARERILAIRLLEKITKNPDYAEKIGVEGRQVEKRELHSEMKLQKSKEI